MELISWLLSLIKGSPYHFVFGILFFCGLGLPIPEEATLIAAVWSTNEGWAEIYPMFIVATAAILLGDLSTYTVGRIFGYRLVRLPYFRRILSEKRLGKVDRFFDRYGDWTVFIARFFAGFRFACYFIAGISRLRVHVFILMDFLAALISVGLTFWVIRSFGKQIEEVVLILRQLNYLILGTLIVGVAGFVGWRWWNRTKDDRISKTKSIPKE